MYMYITCIIALVLWHLFVVHMHVPGTAHTVHVHVFHILQLREVQGDGQQDEASVAELRKYGPTGREYPPHIQEW